MSTEGGPHSSLIPDVTCSILNEVGVMYKEKGTFTDEMLLSLHNVFGSPLERALELLDANGITMLHSPSGRCIMQVTGSSGKLYTLFPSVNYCPCPAYHFQVIGTKMHVSCKHVIAACIAEVTGKHREVEVSNDEISRILCESSGIMHT